jgi:hypothetical protein
MKVQVNTSNDIDNKEALERWANDYLNEHLARFDQDLTSIEVQMTDENHAAKGGGVDKRCMMEARVNGRAPVAVTNYAAPRRNWRMRSITRSASSTGVSIASGRRFGAIRRSSTRRYRRSRELAIGACAPRAVAPLKRKGRLAVS